MQSSIIKIFFCGTLLFYFVKINAQVNSPYSRIGIGNVFSPTFTASNGMGGLSAALFTPTEISYQNPASYPFLLKSIFDVGVYGNFLTLKTNTETFNSGDGNISYVSFGFSPDNKTKRHDFGISAGLIPFSGFQYNIQKDIDSEDSLLGTQEYNYSGNGSIYNFYGGAGYSYDFGRDSITKNYLNTISIGFNIGYLFGTLHNITLASFPDQLNSLSTKYVRTNKTGGLSWNTGLGYQHTFNGKYKLNVGLSGNPKLTIKGTQSVQWFSINVVNDVQYITDTLYYSPDTVGDIVIPSQFTAGISINKNEKEKTNYIVGIEFSKTNWSQYRGFQYSDSLVDNYRIKTGVELVPVRRDKLGKVKRPFSYRAGFYYGTSQLKIYDKQLNELGVTIGMGLPIRGYLSKINLALTIGQRGTTDVIKENYFNFNAGFNLNDLLWFQRRQLN